jgi:uridine kinase
MKGDILIINENHRKAAKLIVDLILRDVRNSAKKYVISIGGESGAGKSEIAASLAEVLTDNGFHCYIFGQDDYFKLPPLTNARQREKDITRVGMQEVNLDLLDQNIGDIINGKTIISKPLVDFNQDTIGTETTDFSKFDVLLVEGTYTTTLQNVDCRIFIDRNKLDTLESRRLRGREKQDEFLEQILSIEHSIISLHKNLANIIVTKNFNAIKKPDDSGR